MPTTQGVDELTLHIDEDGLWFSVGRPISSRWESTIEGFIRQDWVRDSECVKVLGTCSNAHLIRALYDQQVRTGCPHVIKLGSPSLCRLDRGVPEVFRQMLEMEQPPSVGGWHTMTTAEYPTYAMIDELNNTGGRVTDTVRLYLKAHPAYPAISFVNGSDHASAAKLLRVIVDPRFHVCSSHPNRSSKLRAHLGHGDNDGINNVRNYLSISPIKLPGVRYDEAALLLNTWSGGRRSMVAQDAGGPRDFLLRASREIVAKRGPSVGALRTSHIFLRFLRDVWLDRLTVPRIYDVGPTNKLRPCRSYSPTLFVPEHFFANPDEVVAWYYHNGVS